jgi:hypothetical protein
MNRLLNIFITASRSWKVVLAVFIAQMLSFGALQAVEQQFVALTGYPTFDFQNDLTRAAIDAQLSLYTDAARSIYALFAAVDFVFPLVGSLFYCVLYALFLRLNPTPLAQRLLRSPLPMLPLLVTLADWLENVGFVTLINGGQAWGADMGLLFKQFKLSGLTTFSLGVAVLGLWLGAAALLQGLGRRRKSSLSIQEPQ